MAPFPALPHIAVTLSDKAVSTERYGSRPVLDEDEKSGAFHHTAVLVLAFACTTGELELWRE